MGGSGGSAGTAGAAGSAGSGGSGVGLKLTLNHANAIYAPGDAIVVSFTGGPGTHVKDWITIYEDSPNANSPSAMSAPLNWAYVNTSTQTAGATMPMSGMVTLDQTTKGTGANAYWPLFKPKGPNNPAGLPSQYTAYYLQNDGFTILGQVSFTVQ